MQHQRKVMQCPSCGYDTIPDDACFCPRCRFQFKEPEITFDDEPFPAPATDHRVSAPLAERRAPRDVKTRQALLVQPAVLLMAGFAIVLYLLLGPAAEMSMTVMGTALRPAGLFCLGAAAVLAWICYRLMLIRLE